MKLPRPSLVVLAFTFALVARGAGIPPFTIDSVLAGLKDTYPQATRVSDVLPPGVIAFEEVTYAHRSSGDLGLDLYRPAGNEALPAVIIIHGGGWVAGDRRMERAFAKTLAARGYVAVPVSYRLGTPGRFPAPIEDLKEAVRWLRAHAKDYHIDPARIAAVGGSAGANLASMLGVTNGQEAFSSEGENQTLSSDIQAVVNLDGTVTFMDNTLINVSETQPSPYWEYVHGVYSRNRETWLAASPLYYVDRHSAPTLFIKSTCVQPVLVGRDEMAQRMGVLGVHAEVIQIPDTPHPFWLVHPWFEQVVADTDHFLRHELTPRH